MPTFQYVAKTLGGKTQRGVMEAPDETRLATNLRGESLFLVSCREESQSASSSRLHATELADFCREIGTMLDTGVPLLRAVQIISKRDQRKSVQQIYNALATSLQQGASLSEAMHDQHGVFPELLVNMFRAGETSGHLSKTALQMAVHYEKEHRLHVKLRNAITYPIILLVVTVVVMIVIFAFVLPNFFNLFEGITLPWPTRFIMALSNGLVNHWLAILIGVLLAIALISFICSLQPVRRGIDHLKLRIPWTGKLMKVIYTARFARTLSALYQSGLSMTDALATSRGTIGNRYIADQFDTVLADVRQGAPLSDAIAKVDGFDMKLPSTILVGEESGKLDEMLESIADSFDYESEMAAQKLTTILEPALIILMAVLIGFIMLAVMLPIFDIYNSIG